MVIATIIAQKYTLKDAEIASERLSPGEKAVLQEVAAELGWPSIKSLVVKYFPVCPRHDLWQTALHRMRHRARRTNIRYLLKTLQSIMEELKGKAYSGRESRNRLSSRLERHIRSKDIDLSRVQSIRERAVAQNKTAMEGPRGQRVLALMGAAC